MRESSQEGLEKPGSPTNKEHILGRELLLEKQI